jgi:hypothetical protein
MNPAEEPLDELLLAQFARTHTDLGPESFVRTLKTRIEAATARRRTLRLVQQALGLAALVLASPWLIDVSRRLSSPFEAGVAATADWLLTPLGAAAGLVLLAVVFTALRVIKAR